MHRKNLKQLKQNKKKKTKNYISQNNFLKLWETNADSALFTTISYLKLK